MPKVLKDYLTMLGLAWIGCLVVFIFVYLLALKPQSMYKHKLSKELEEMKRNYVAAREISNKGAREQLALDVEKLQQQLHRFVADANDYENLTFDIGRIANKIRVISFSIKGKNIKGLFEIPKCKLIGENKMEISFSGDFNQFASFLNALERHEPVLFVDTFKIDRSNRDNETNKVSMSLSVFVETQES
jgi:Tfp pilus assembly protein PilO